MGQVQNSDLAKGLIAYLPLQEWHTQPGADLVTNGTFDTDSDWTKSGVTISTGKLVFSSASDDSYAYQNVVGVSSNDIITISITISDYSEGTIYWRFGTSNTVDGTGRTANGIYTETFLNTSFGDSRLYIWGDGTITANVDNVVLRKVNQNAIDLITGTQGTVSGAYPIVDRHGGGRRWYSFDRTNNDIVTTTSGLLGDNQDFSFVTKVKINDIEAMDDFFLQIYTDGNNYQRFWHRGGGSLGVYGKYNSGVPNDDTENGFFTVNEWVVIAGVCDISANTITIYKNGSLSHIVDIADTISLSGTVYLGDDDGSNDWDGDIAYTYLFNYALSESEVSNYSDETYPVTFADRGADNSATTYTFDSDTEGFSITSGDEISTWTHDTDHGVLAVTSAGTQSIRPNILKSGIMTTGKRYRVSMDYTVNSGTFVLKGIYDGASQNGGGTYTGSGTIEIEATFTTPNLTIYFDGRNEMNVSIDNISLTELGNTLNLNASGIYDNIWLDRDHDISATVSGATKVIPSGSNLGAYFFDGVDDYISYSDMDGLTGDITITGWFYATGWGEDFDNGGLIFISKVSESAKFMVATAGSSERLYHSRNGGAVAHTGNNSIDLGKWYYYAITSTSAGVTNFYIGDMDTAPALSGSADQDAGTPVSGTAWHMGNASAGNRTFDGLIGSIKIYSRILTTDEIQLDYDSYAKQ
nr:hypothetical protein 16 [bacterium]